MEGTALIVVPFFRIFEDLNTLDMGKLLVTVVSAVAFLLVVTSCKTGGTADNVHDAEVLKEYRQQWRSYNMAGMDDSLILFTRPILEEALRKGDTLTALFSGVYMAQAWLFMEQMDSTLRYLNMMEPYVDRQDDNILKYLYYSIYGGYSIKAELNYSKAMEYYFKSYEYALKSEDYGNQLGILLDIIYIFYIRSDSQGMEYAKEAYDLAMSEEVSQENRCSAETMMAMMFHISGDDKSAMKYVQMASRLAKENRLLTLYSLIYKVYGDIYSSGRDYRMAEKCYDSALVYAGYADAGTETFVYLDYGRMLQTSGQNARADRMLRKGLEISYKYGNHECRKEILSSLVDNALVSGNRNNIVSYLETYRSYLDSVSSTQRELEFNSLLMSMQKMEYENRAQAVQLRNLKARQRLMANIALLLIVIIIISFLLVMSHKQRNTYRLLVEKYQKYAEQFKRDSMTTKDADRELFDKVESLMRDQKVYRQKSLTRDSLADMLGTNRTYLSRAINNISGKTFSEYLNSWRIVEATLIMADKSSDIPLKQLADDLGYSSISVFYRSFQKETGVTAGKYLKEVRSRQ